MQGDNTSQFATVYHDLMKLLENQYGFVNVEDCDYADKRITSPNNSWCVCYRHQNESRYKFFIRHGEDNSICITSDPHMVMSVIAKH